jgi:hypothetical protein
MREFPKSSTLSPNSKASEFSSLMTLGQNYEPMNMNGGAPVFQNYGQIIHESTLEATEALLSNLEFGTFEEREHNWQMPGDNVIPWSGPEALFLDRNALENRAFDIRDKLKYTASSLHTPHLPPQEIQEAIELMTADNVAAWIKLYFKHWHKHAPLVHEPSFNPHTAALPLVLALMSLGGMVSYTFSLKPSHAYHIP